MNISGAILYPTPSSVFLNVMSVVTVILTMNGGISEVRGAHISYSKFWNWKEVKSGKSGAGTGAKVSGRTGMFFSYAPAMVVALASFFVSGVMAAPREPLVSAAIGLHFLKRVLEVRRLILLLLFNLIIGGIT
jgi:hypothetical protein